MKWALAILLAATPALADPAWDAFTDVASVLKSPRCLSCHVPGESPLQVDATRTHAMNVKRGTDGRGTTSLHCSTCHQDANAELAHAPPGAPDWRMPPPEAKMAWLGLDTPGLCRALTDPARNGGRDLAALEEHVKTDHLVAWGFQPGPGRALPPLSREAFVARFLAWTRGGAPCAPRSQP